MEISTFLFQSCSESRQKLEKIRLYFSTLAGGILDPSVVSTFFFNPFLSQLSNRGEVNEPLVKCQSIKTWGLAAGKLY